MWLDFFKGECSVALGYLLCCPTTNFRFFNLNPELIPELDLLVTIKFFLASFPDHWLASVNLHTAKGIQSFANKCKALFLSEISKGGHLFSSLSFEEPSDVSSKLELELLGTPLNRTGGFATIIVKGGSIPDANLTRPYLEK